MILPSPLFKMGPELLPVDYNVPPALKPEPGGRRWPVAVPAPRRRAEADAELARRARTTLNRLPWSAEIEAEDARRQRAVEARCALFDLLYRALPRGCARAARGRRRRIRALSLSEARLCRHAGAGARRRSVVPRRHTRVDGQRPGAGTCGVAQRVAAAALPP